MNTARQLFVAMLLAGGFSAPPGHAQTGEVTAPAVHVVLQTTLGNIRLALDAQRAPVTTANFLRYVDAKRFDGVDFYRAVAIGDAGNLGMVQGGIKGDRARVFEPIAHESPAVTGLSHVDGAISMARLDPGTATADFFLIVGDLVSLDGDPARGDPGYAVFGRVVDGMSVVRQILAQPRDPAAGEEGMRGQMLAQPVKIVIARRDD